MDIKNVNNIMQVANNTKMFMMSLDAYMSRIDLLRNSINAVDTEYVYSYALDTWTYYDISISQYLIFETDLPANFVPDLTNTMYYSLYNMSNLLVYYLGELTIPENYGIANTELPMWWGYDASKLYLYIPTDGNTADKYSFWLPNNYTDEEYNIFFTRAHEFYLDYKI